MSLVRRAAGNIQQSDVTGKLQSGTREQDCGCKREGGGKNDLRQVGDGQRVAPWVWDSTGRCDSIYHNPALGPTLLLRDTAVRTGRRRAMLQSSRRQDKRVPQVRPGSPY